MNKDLCPQMHLSAPHSALGGRHRMCGYCFHSLKNLEPCLSRRRQSPVRGARRLNLPINW